MQQQLQQQVLRVAGNNAKQNPRANNVVRATGGIEYAVAVSHCQSSSLRIRNRTKPRMSVRYMVWCRHNHVRRPKSRM